MGSVNVAQGAPGWYAPYRSPPPPPPPQTPDQTRTPPRPIDNRPAWLTQSDTPGSAKRIDFDLKEDKIEDEPNHKQGRLCVVSASVFVSKLAQERIIRQMPLDLDNGLPGILLRLGNKQSNSTCFLCHVDSCTAMNTGN